MTRGHPPIAVTVDVALLTIRDGRLSLLLVRRGAAPYKGRWALPGGFVEPGEGLDDAARRELGEEAGVPPDLDLHLEQLRTYGTPGRDPRGPTVSVAHLALAPDVPDPRAGDDAAGARYWTVDDLTAGDGAHRRLAFDHARIVADAVERARAKLEYSPLATALLPRTFTLAELRGIYEAVWGVTLDAANFRRKVLSTPGLVDAVGTSRRPPGGGRPAALFRAGKATLVHPAMLRPSAS